MSRRDTLEFQNYPCCMQHENPGTKPWLGLYVACALGCAGQAVQQAQTTEALEGEEPAREEAAFYDAKPVAREASVPTFVVSGSGAWTATSCDLGAHWVVSERSPDHEDHGPFSNMPGVLAERGLFLLATGWGASGQVYASEDAVEWRALPPDVFRHKGVSVPLGFHAALIRSLGRFLLFGGPSFQSMDGLTWISWEPEFPSHLDQLRLVRSIPERGIILISAENQRHEEHALGHFPLVSRDGGRTFQEGQGLAQACGGGSASAFFDETLFLGNRALCQSRDFGATWSVQEFSHDAEEITALFSDDKALYAVAGDKLYSRGQDGAFKLVFTAEVRLRLGGFGAGTYVLVANDGSKFFTSRDLVTWRKGEVENPILNYNLRGFAFGYGVPSPRCRQLAGP